MKSQYYNDPCTFLEIEHKEYTQKERQLMFAYDITHCDSNCNYKEHSSNSKFVSCECSGESEKQKQKVIEEEKVLDISEYFDSSTFNIDASYLFKCSQVVSSFPNLLSWLHWSAIIEAIAWIVFMIIFWIKIRNFNKFLVAFVKSPAAPPKSKSKESKNKLIELQNVSRNSISVRRSTNVNSFSQSRALLKEEVNLLSLENGLNLDHRSDCLFYIDIIKEKILFVSIYYYGNILYPFSMKIMNHLFALISMIFFNAFYFTDSSNTNKKLSNQIGTCFLSYIITYVIFIITESIMMNPLILLDMTKHKDLFSFNKVNSISRKIIIESCVILLIYFASYCIFWYFLFIFGVVQYKEQGTILIMTVISLIIFIFFQALIALACTLFRKFGREKKNKCLYITSLVLYFLL